MNSTPKAIAMVLLLSTAAIMTVAPSAQAEVAEPKGIPNPICLDGDWTTVCLGTSSTTRQIPDVDPSRLVFHCTDPVGTGDVCVPTVPSVVDAITASRTVSVATATYSYDVHGENIIYDICMIVFGNPYVCRYTQLELADADSSGTLDSILVDGVAVPFTFA